jgi:hypothetical protein
VANLEKIFEKYGKTVAGSNLHETTSDDNEESVTKLPRLVVNCFV